MRALAYDRYGGPHVLSVRDLPDPVPRRGEVVVRVAAAALNPKDILVRKGKFKIVTGRRFPKVPGYDFAGTVELGAGDMRAGTAVFGMLNRWSAGTCAELVRVPLDELGLKPNSIGMPEAAAVPLAALTSLQAMRDLLALKPGMEVVVNGASGGVGTFAVQIGKRLGARVIAVCSRRNADLVTALGADEVVPYDEQPITELGREVDAFFDVFGSGAQPKIRHLLNAHGRFVTTIPTPQTVFRDIATRWSRRPARLVVVKSRRGDLDQLRQWIDAGVLRPVVDRVLPLADGADAQIHIETRRARGKVVLTLAGDAS
jgi:NADPH:quinone reductase-like Zn-dependent oxidoreductase